MVEINVFKPIDKEDPFMTYFFGGDDMVFSADAIHAVFDENPTETEFRFNINCDGGSVHEGLRIYDVIRTSGKTIYTNIEGGCHSMAVILLLAAPKENRSANRNARALIHEVHTSVWGDDLTADELRDIADEVDEEEQNILNIYAERTGTDYDTLEAFMEEEKMRDANFLKKYGFISTINNYNTNFFNSMNRQKPKNKKQSLLKRTENFLGRIKNLLQAEPVNYDFTDDDGNVLFSTEIEDDTLEVGMAATPDGTFELPDGRTVTIEDGAISEIIEASGSEEENLREQVNTLTNSLLEAQGLIGELQAQVRSNYNVAPRVKQPQKNATVPANKDDVRAKLAKARGGK
jgi:ATP-dependent Clp protease protease subunit